MLRAGIKTHSGSCLASDGVVGQHTLNGELHSLFGLLRHKFSVLYFFKMSDIAGVPSVILVVQFLSRKDSLCTVDDYYMIAAVAMRSECGLMLSSEDMCGFCGNTSERLARSVKNIPLALYRLGFRHIS